MSRLAQFLQESLWMITPERYSAILGAIELIEAGRYSFELGEKKENLKPFMMIDGAKTEYAEPRGQTPGQARAVLVLPFQGTIYPRSGGTSPLSGGVSLQETMQVLRRAWADPGIGSIVGDFDTSGGMATGLPEFATEIRSMRGIKPMTAVVNFQAASAGYYIASQFDEVVASPSASLGSIGVIAQYTSAAKRIEDMGYKVQTLRYPPLKAEADGIAELSDEAVAFRMGQIRKLYDQFEAAVAAGMRVDVADVSSKFGQGRSFDADEAVAVGMATRIGTFDGVLAEHIEGAIAKRKPYKMSRRERGMSEDEPAVIAEEIITTEQADDDPVPPVAAPTRTAAELAARWDIK